VSVALSEVCIPKSDVARYIGRTPQSLSSYIRGKLLVPKDRRTVTLANVNRFLARKFPRLAPFATWDEYVTWAANGRPPAQ
jgi:hypothetical protein